MVVESLKWASSYTHVILGLLSVCSCYLCIIDHAFSEAFTEKWTFILNATIAGFPVG